MGADACELTRSRCCQKCEDYAHLLHVIDIRNVSGRLYLILIIILKKDIGIDWWARASTDSCLHASAMLKHVLAIGWTSVSPSVCPSVCHTLVCIKTVEHIVMLSWPHDSPFILVLCISRSSRNSDGVTPCGAAKQRWGRKMSQFSTNNLLYLRNGWR